MLEFTFQPHSPKVRITAFVATSQVSSQSSIVKLEDLNRQMNVNFMGVFHCKSSHITDIILLRTLTASPFSLGFQHASRQMLRQGRGGRIIGASSILGKKGKCSIVSYLLQIADTLIIIIPGAPFSAAYTSSKFAIRGLTQSVGKDK
jgi:NAD(P)-dependent dehydrogenase (short-subunit alcohol dehydrogenase family)